MWICFQLTLPLDLKNGVLLHSKNLSFSAPMALTQFSLIRQTFSSLENGRTVDVEFVLQRIISYHLTNTFIPTISLLVISEITLTFDETQTELAMGLSLTIMLVMYTMYQSISDSLTKTAYLKMIDYWLLFCLLTPFAIFLIDIFWLTKHRNLNKKVQQGWVHEENKGTDYRKVIQYIVPIITGTFIIAYFVSALIITFSYA